MRDLLRHPDQRLVQEIYELEKRDPENDAELNRFNTLRSDLSRMAWNSFAAALDSPPVLFRGRA